MPASLQFLNLHYILWRLTSFPDFLPWIQMLKCSPVQKLKLLHKIPNTNKDAFKNSHVNLSVQMTTERLMFWPSITQNINLLNFSTLILLVLKNSKYTHLRS